MVCKWKQDGNCNWRCGWAWCRVHLVGIHDPFSTLGDDNASGNAYITTEASQIAAPEESDNNEEMMKVDATQDV